MHPEIVRTHEAHWQHEGDCEDFARALASAMLKAGPADGVIELHGTLGAGKTTFTRHLLRALGVKGRIKSPSFAVVEHYPARQDGQEGPLGPVWHFDFYRFSDPREWADAGFRDTFAGPGLKLCEWPELAGNLLPVPDWRLHLDVIDEDRRHVTVQACTARGMSWLRLMDAQAFQDGGPQA